MGTRKRGQVLKGPDEVNADRRERERSNQTSPPTPPQIEEPPTLPPLHALPPQHFPMVPTIGDFALNALMAREYARLAREAGMLDVNCTDAQAQLLVLRGFEMGISPIRALTELYWAPTEQGGLEIVEEATLLRARVAQSGLGVIEPVPEQCNTQSAMVHAIRHDHLGHRQAYFRYTLDDATTDGLMLKRTWQSGANREALLVARATTKAARAWFSDVEGARYTAEELGGDGTARFAPEVGGPARPSAPPSPSVSPDPAPVAPPAVAAADAAGATDAGGPHPPVAPPPGPAAEPKTPPPAPPPPTRGGAPEGASRQEKMAYYADVSRAMNRPWTSNVGMSRDAQPVPIVTHGVTTAQITGILNYTVRGRASQDLGPDGFARADDALRLVVDYLGTLGIDAQLCPPPYCFFALNETEAGTVLQGLAAFAREDAEGDTTEQEPIDVTEPPEEFTAPPNAHDEVQPGMTHSWTQANDYLEAVLRRVIGHATRADVLGMLHQATRKEFYEMNPDELFGAAADIDRLGKNPTILKQAIERMRIARGE